jgi:DNA helicase IV
MAGAWWLGENDLDDDQKGVIGLAAEGNHLVVGPPGSGKTNILLLRAKYMSLSRHPNIAIVVFTRSLSRFIASGGRDYGFPADKITTCAKWQRDILQEYGAFRPAPPGTFQQQREHVTRQLSNLAEQRNLSGLFDAILLDEAQDYTAEEIALFKRLGKQLFAVADSRQQIYLEDHTKLAAIRAAVDQVHTLRFHYRNGKSICKLADSVAKDSEDYEPLLPTSKYNEEENPSQVSTFQGDLNAQCGKMAETLRTQLRVYKGEFLAVICPKKEHVNAVMERLQREQDLNPFLCRIEDDAEAFHPSRLICVSTVHSAKGLEVRAVHFATAEHVKRSPNQRNLVFTAATRAKTSLTIYHEGDLKGWFEGAVEALKPPRPQPTIRSLFQGAQ